MGNPLVARKDSNGFIAMEIVGYEIPFSIARLMVDENPEQVRYLKGEGLSLYWGKVKLS